MFCSVAQLGGGGERADPLTLPDAAAGMAGAAVAAFPLHIAGRAPQCVTRRKRTLDPSARDIASDFAPGSSSLDDE